MVYEIYELMDNGKKLNIFAALQTIDMKIKKIASRDDFQKWMDEKGLIKENGWDLDNAFEITVDDYNQLCNCHYENLS